MPQASVNQYPPRSRQSNHHSTSVASPHGSPIQPTIGEVDAEPPALPPGKTYMLVGKTPGAVCNREKWRHTVDGSEILHQLRLVVYPIIYRVLYIPSGAGFLPSTVPSEISMQACKVAVHS